MKERTQKKERSPNSAVDDENQQQSAAATASKPSDRATRPLFDVLSSLVAVRAQYSRSLQGLRADVGFRSPPRSFRAQFGISSVLSIDIHSAGLRE